MTFQALMDVIWEWRQSWRRQVTLDEPSFRDDHDTRLRALFVLALRYTTTLS